MDERLYQLVVERLKKIGVFNVHREELFDIISGVKQDRNNYIRCLKDIEHNKREIEAIQQNLEVAEKAVSNIN